MGFPAGEIIERHCAGSINAAYFVDDLLMIREYAVYFVILHVAGNKALRQNISDMDILRKELNGIYSSQELYKEVLNPMDLEQCNAVARSYMSVSKGCTVITDASCDHCYLYLGPLSKLLGLADSFPMVCEADSSDEDIIYNRIHPEDLADKRMLEYEFFKFVDAMPGDEKLRYQATCILRIKNITGDYTVVDNSTQVICPSPAGRIWLILCCYSLSSCQEWTGNISPAIKNNHSGEVIEFSFNDRRRHILTDREKEILLMIKDGKLSKQIADILEISVHTVNRHRQNILEKLSVGNSIEAILAAESMRLI